MCRGTGGARCDTIEANKRGDLGPPPPCVCYRPVASFSPPPPLPLPYGVLPVVPLAAVLTSVFVPTPRFRQKGDSAIVEETQEEPSSAGEEAAAEEAGEEPIVVETAPYDIRIPSQNQAKECFTKYEEFYKCTLKDGKSDEQCLAYKRAYRTFCPNEWWEQWEELRGEGRFYGKY
jgi:cytochrome c oxidase subunit 6b